MKPKFQISSSPESARLAEREAAAARKSLDTTFIAAVFVATVVAGVLISQRGPLGANLRTLLGGRPAIEVQPTSGLETETEATESTDLPDAV